MRYWFSSLHASRQSLMRCLHCSRHTDLYIEYLQVLIRSLIHCKQLHEPIYKRFIGVAGYATIATNVMIKTESMQGEIATLLLFYSIKNNNIIIIIFIMFFIFSTLAINNPEG